MIKFRCNYIEKRNICKLIILLLHYFYMMNYNKARYIQSIIVFSIVLLTGAGISVYSKMSNREGEVEGAQDSSVYKEDSVTDLNSTPVFKSEPPINGYVGEEYTYYVSVYDSDSANLTLSILRGPNWLRVDGLKVYGTPVYASSSEGIKVVLQISDGKNNSEQTFYLNIAYRDE